MKLSLHESGQWHIGFDSKRRDQLFSPEQHPPTRFLGKWYRPETKTSPVILAARVYFPSNSLSEAPRSAPSDTIWLPSAPDGQATMVGIFIVNFATEVVNWSGEREGTQLTGRIPLEGGGQVCAVHSFVSTWPTVPTISGNPNFFRGKSESDLEQANRAVAWGEETDGSISFVEFSLAVQSKGTT
jgi:hypothetical protein